MSGRWYVWVMSVGCRYLSLSKTIKCIIIVVVDAVVVDAVVVDAVVVDAVVVDAAAQPNNI